MKPAKLMFIILFLIWFCGLTAQNHMDLILSIEGAHENSLVLKRMAAIDFNADGYDDLILPQNRSTSLSVPAKIHRWDWLLLTRVLPLRAKSLTHDQRLPCRCNHLH